jgi:hypothetical protein
MKNPNQSRLMLITGLAIVSGAVLTAQFYQNKSGLSSGAKDQPSNTSPKVPSKKLPIPIEKARVVSSTELQAMRAQNPNSELVLNDIRRNLAELPPGADAYGLVDDFITFSPEEAIEWVLSQSPEGMYESSYVRVGRYVGEQGHEKVADILKKVGPKQAFPITQGAVVGLGLTSPLRALELKLHTERETGKQVLWSNDNLYVNAIKGNNIEEAIFAARTLYSGYSQIHELGSLYRMWAAWGKPETAASDLLARAFPKETESKILQLLLLQWSSNKGIGRVKQWMKTLSPDRLELVQQELSRISANK